MVEVIESMQFNQASCGGSVVKVLSHSSEEHVFKSQQISKMPLFTVNLK